MIVDSHLHLPVRKKTGTFEDSKAALLTDLERNGVDYAILIPDNVPGSVIGDLDIVLELTRNVKRLFVMGTVNVFREEGATLQKLDSLFDAKRIVAIKIFPGHDPIYPTDRRLEPVYALCIKYDLPIVIHTGWNSNNPKVAKYNDPKHIAKVASKFPQLKIVISHYFWPEVEYCHSVTKPFSNIYFDTSGLADDEVIRETGLQNIKEVLTLTANERPDNVLFGTDYAMCSIKKHIDLINSLDIDEGQKEKIFCRNAIELFKLRLET
jgi:predicted TIM-barrel fold metal-dependent hydrolase